MEWVKERIAGVEEMKKKQIKNMEIKVNNNGVSIWINKRWVMDASLIKDKTDKEYYNKLTVSTDRMKVLKKNQKYPHHLVYEFYGDKND